MVTETTLCFWYDEHSVGRREDEDISHHSRWRQTNPMRIPGKGLAIFQGVVGSLGGTHQCDKDGVIVRFETVICAQSNEDSQENGYWWQGREHGASSDYFSYLRFLEMSLLIWNISSAFFIWQNTHGERVNKSWLRVWFVDSSALGRRLWPQRSSALVLEERRRMFFFTNGLSG